MNEDLQKKVTNMWKQYEDGLSYQSTLKLDATIKQNVNFFEGRQWAATTELTASLPRPVVNLIRFIVRSKTSAILSTPVKLVYEADTNEADGEKFTRFVEYMQKEMRMDELDAEAVKDTGAVKGTYVYHFYYDAEAKGKRGNYDGALRCDLIDPRNTVFANPLETDEQKQEYIIISKRETVSSVKAQAHKSVDKEKITTDDADDSFINEEQEGTDLCTVLTKYFRKNGVVYCEQATKKVIIRPAFPLTPDLKAAAKEAGIDEAILETPDDLGDKDNRNGGVNGHNITLYPIVVGQYEKRDGSIYGLSEVEGLIPNQRIINFTLALTVLALQQTGWSKWIVSKDALDGQEITNEPGQVITDYSALGSGIKKQEAPQLSAMPLNLLSDLFSWTRTVSGATEVMTGEPSNAGMSGAAIAQLQAQAQQPIEELRDAFWRVKVKQGRILEQFFRVFYDTPYNFSYKTELTDELKAQVQHKPDNAGMVKINDKFSAKDYTNVDFTVVAKATKGTRSSIAGDIAMLETLLTGGHINVLEFAKAYPDEALSDKEGVIKLLEQARQSESAQLKELIAQRENELAQAAQYLEKTQKALNAVQSTNNENEQLKKDLAIVYDMMRKAMNGAQKLNEIGQETYNDATMFAQELSKSGKLNKVNNAPTA